MTSPPLFFYPFFMVPFLFILSAYLLGSVPVGIILARFRGIDPRTGGSGNIGATNVMRTAGKGIGILTLIGDTAKGFLPVLAARHFLGDPWFVAGTGLAALLGHLFPLYLRFRGGKGIATGLGVFLAVSPFASAVNIAVFIIVFATSRYVSLGSLIGAAVMPFTLFLMKAPVAYVLLAVAIGIFVFVKHRDNIRRLLAGTERKVTFSKKT